MRARYAPAPAEYLRRCGPYAGAPLTGRVAGVHLGVVRFFPIPIPIPLPVLGGCGRGDLIHRLKIMPSDTLLARDMDVQDAEVAVPRRVA